MQGIAVFPSPAKEYILRPQVSWNPETWIALGGVVGTAVAVLGATQYFLRVRNLVAEAALFGAFVPPWVYSIRFLVRGRGHGETEWQAAQTALGLAPAGHAIDAFFLLLLLGGIIVWASRSHFSPRYRLLRLIGAVIGGTVLLVALQVANNGLLDRFFPVNQVVGEPLGLDPR
jgi:hypothetical protein